MFESLGKGNNRLSKAEKVTESNNCQDLTQFPMFLSQIAKILSSSYKGRNWEPDNDGNWISLQWVETQRRHNLIYEKQKQMWCLFYKLPCQFLPSIFPDWLCTLRGQWLLFDSLPLTGLIHHQDETEKNGVPGDYEGLLKFCARS